MSSAEGLAVHAGRGGTFTVPAFPSRVPPPTPIPYPMALCVRLSQTRLNDLRERVPGAIQP